MFGGGEAQHTMKIWTQSDLMIVKLRGQKDLRTMKKGVNKIKDQGEIWYKMIPTVK